jgi:hypothetical protein
MTTDEQLAIIRNWTTSFKVLNAAHGNKYGVLLFNDRYSGMEYVGPYRTHAEVVGIAYDLVYDHVWNQVE